MPHGAIPFPFGDCRICNDKATGVHYGVATCEGCKGFYKRSIPKGDKYRCYFGGACIISPQNRNRCKACRFRRCLEQGMAVEAVKMGRIPKIQKDKALEEAAAQKKEKTIPELSEICDSLSEDPDYSEFTAGQEKTPRVCKRKYSFGIKVENTGGDSSDSAYIVDKKQDTVGVLGSGVDGTDAVNCTDHFHTQAVQKQGTYPVAPDLFDHAWETPGDFSQHPHHQGSESLEEKETFGEGEVSCLPLPSQLSLPLLNMPVKQEHMPSSSQEMQQCYNEMPADSLQGNMSRQVGEKQMMDNENIVPGCPDKSGICGVSCSPEKRLESPHLNRSDGRFSPGFGGKLRNYSPGLIEVLFNQMVESENGDTEKAKEKLLKRLANTLGQERNLSSFQTSYTTTSGTAVLPETSQPRSKLGSDMDSSGESYVSNSSNLAAAENSDASFSSVLLSPPYTSFHSGQHDLHCVGHEEVNENFKQPAVFFDNTRVKPPDVAQTEPSTFQKLSVSVSCPQFKGNADSSSTLPPSQQDCNILFCEPTSSFLDNHIGQSTRSLNGNESSHNAFSQSNVQMAFPHFKDKAANAGSGHRFSSLTDSSMHDCNRFSQGMAFPGQQAQSHRSPVSECTGVVCPTEDLVSFPSQLHSFSEDYLTLTQDKDDLLRDPDEVLSFDSNSSVSSGEHMSLPDETRWEEAIQKLEKSLVERFQLLRNRQEARDKYLKQKDGSSSLPQLKDMALLWQSLMRSLSQLNEAIIVVSQVAQEKFHYSGLLAYLCAQQRGFCKDAPGFVALNHADQGVLLKCAYYDIWILTQSEFFVDGESYLVLDDGTFYTRALMQQVVGQEVTDSFHRFTLQFNALGLSQLEIAVLCCIQLTTTPQDQNLKRPEDIQKLNSFYVDLLVHLVNESHGAASSRVLVDIFRLVPLLAEVNRLQRDVIGSLKIDNPTFKKTVLGQ